MAITVEFGKQLGLDKVGGMNGFDWGGKVEKEG
jgi:hypothetical protein